MDWEGVVIGGVAVIWGVMLFSMRSQMLEFSREGGKGLRNRRVINALVMAAVLFLLAAGIAVIAASFL
jgi:hypothetical protein